MQGMSDVEVSLRLEEQDFDLKQKPITGTVEKAQCWDWFWRFLVFAFVV